MIVKKRLKLKRKYLVILTIIVTLLSINSLNLISSRIEQINKTAEQCDSDKGYTCSAYELRQYLLNK